MSDFLDYIKKPYYIKSQQAHVWQLIKLFILLFIIVLIFLGTITSFFDLVFKFKNNSITIYNLNNYLKLVVIAPIIEEMVFRFFLKPKYKNIIILVVFMTILGIYYYIVKKTLNYIIVILLINIIFFYLIYNKAVLKKFQIHFINYFSIYFCSFSIIFALLHSFNYQIENPLFYIILPLIVAPQFIMGLFFGYIRMKYNILYSIFFHCLNNFLLSTPFLIHIIKLH